MQKGKIDVTSENIFPIIKKFLYSDHEIFLRELVSNAVDATQKLRTLASLGEYQGELGDQTIVVELDRKNKTLKVTDKGIGMTEDEVKKYINQIAFSSAEEFLEKYRNQSNNIIGHFGLGFYSAFMVSEKVEIFTRSYKEGSEAVHWVCDGSPEYSIENAVKEDFGTEVILHIDNDSEEFLDESRISGILRKYCKFLPVEIAFGKETEWKDGKEVETGKLRIINNTKPLWTKKPVDVKKEEYNEFYRDLYPVSEEPLFNIHLNVDYPFNLTGILYFPKIRSNIEVQKNKIQLYCNQVFVTDSVEGIVPEFLTLLHGVIDSPDIPLNVSRSYLQSDSNVKKISSHITKKVADRLEEIFKENRSEFESKWDSLKLFITYGMITEEKFYERAEKFALLKNTDGKYFTIEEYQKLVKDNQTDRNKTLVMLYTQNVMEQHAFIEKARAKGYDVLVMDGQLDPHFLNHLEQKLKDVRFTRVDSEVADRLIEKEESKKTELEQSAQSELTEVVEGQVPEKSRFMVQLQALGEEEAPMTITQSEFMRRMKDMSVLGGMASFYGSLPESYNLVVNTDHALIKRILEEKEKKLGKKLEGLNVQKETLSSEIKEIEEQQKSKKAEEVTTEEKDQLDSLRKQEEELNNQKTTLLQEFGSKNKVLKQLIDLALLSNNLLKGEALTGFVKRSVELIK